MGGPPAAKRIVIESRGREHLGHMVEVITRSLPSVVPSGGEALRGLTGERRMVIPSFWRESGRKPLRASDQEPARRESPKVEHGVATGVGVWAPPGGSGNGGGGGGGGRRVGGGGGGLEGETERLIRAALGNYYDMPVLYRHMKAKGNEREVMAFLMDRVKKGYDASFFLARNLAQIDPTLFKYDDIPVFIYLADKTPYGAGMLRHLEPRWNELLVGENLKLLQRRAKTNPHLRELLKDYPSLKTKR